MAYQPFYHHTIRNVVVAFGSLFNELQIEREDSNGVFKTIHVPIIYATKEKFILRINQQADDIVSDKPKIEEVLPRMSYEITGLNYDSERKTNTVKKIRGKEDTEKFIFNKVPYILNFSLYIATRKIDDSLRIVEQIVPYFTPELVLTIKDLDELGLETHIPIVLESTNFEIDSEGTFDDRRTVFWSLDFTAKLYLYAAIRDSAIIKKSTVDMNDIASSVLMERYTATVDPITAQKQDSHTIIETITQ